MPSESVAPGGWLVPASLTPFQGDESFHHGSGSSGSGTGRDSGTDAGTVLDFWRYAMPDLRTNTTRGLLAEFLVHRAVGAVQRNVEWESFDVLAPDGLRIEVKTSAYLQSWGQRRLSEIRFSRLRGRVWTPEDGDAAEQSYNADVYVFALHIARTHAEYDPLDVGQWHFHVASRALVEATGQASLGLASVERLCGAPVTYQGLADRIRVCAQTSLPSGGTASAAATPDA